MMIKKPISFATNMPDVSASSRGSSSDTAPVRLNVQLHQQLIQQGSIRASSRSSAQAALQRIRQQRGG